MVSAAATVIAACTPTHNVRGNMIEDYQITEIHAGIDTQSDVLHKLGSPTTKAPFDDNVWYYLGQETEKRGILDDQVTKERIVTVTFDTAGVVQTVETNAGNRMEIPYARRKTPTTGNEITVMQQLLGNLGKFNKDEAAKE